MDTTYAYQFLNIEKRPGKPRQAGLTICRDHMRDLGGQRNFLQMYGEFVDYVKINSLHPCLYPESVLKEKLLLYNAYKVIPFPGGMLFEAALAQNRLDQFFKHLNELGYSAVEISENVLSLSENEKIEAVKWAKKLGLKVFYEWGNKYPVNPLDVNTAVTEIKRLLGEGVDFIILERSEIDMLLGPDCNKATAPQFIELIDRVGLKHIIPEAKNIKHKFWLIEKFGRDINIGPSVDWEELQHIEPARLGIGRHTGYPIMNQWIGQDKFRSSLEVKLQYKMKDGGNAKATREG